jgi:hypothetical protein
MRPQRSAARPVPRPQTRRVMISHAANAVLFTSHEHFTDHHQPFVGLENRLSEQAVVLSSGTRLQT